MSLAVLASITDRHGPGDGRQPRRLRPADHAPGLRPGHRRRDHGSPIACGSTREAVCPPCARKARVLRMQQCAEGWHRDTEPEPPDQTDDQADDDQDDDDQADDEDVEGSRRVRSTRRRQDAPDLPRVPMDDRTVGRTFTAADGKEYRPSMFLTLTLPSYGRSGRAAGSRSTRARMTTGGPRWMRCTSRSWSTGSGRTCAGAPATRCSTSPPSNPSAGSPRTCTPRSAASSPGRCSRQVIEATYVQVWWPPHDQPVYVAPATGVDRRRLLRPRHRRHAADLGAGARPARGRPGRRAGARDAVRHASTTWPASSPRQPTRTGPSATWPST